MCAPPWAPQFLPSCLFPGEEPLARARVWAHSTPNGTEPLWDPGHGPAAVWACLENTGVEERAGGGRSRYIWGPGSWRLQPPWPRLFCQRPLPPASSEGLAASMRPLVGALNGPVRNQPPRLWRACVGRPRGEATWGDHTEGPRGETTWGDHRERRLDLARERGALVIYFTNVALVGTLREEGRMPDNHRD